MDNFNIEVGIKLDDSTVGEQLKKIQNTINNKKNKEFGAVFDLDTTFAVGKINGLTDGIGKLKNSLKEMSDIQINPFRGINTSELSGMLNILKQLNKYNQGININFNSNIVGSMDNITSELEKGKLKIDSEAKAIARTIQNSFTKIGMPATSDGVNLYQEYYKKILSVPKAEADKLIEEITTKLSNLPRLAYDKFDLGTSLDSKEFKIAVKTEILKLQEELTEMAKVYKSLKGVGFVQDYNEKNNVFNSSESSLKHYRKLIEEDKKAIEDIIKEKEQLKEKQNQLFNDVVKSNLKDEELDKNQYDYNNIEDQVKVLDDYISRHNKSIEGTQKLIALENESLRQQINLYPELLKDVTTYHDLAKGSVKITDGEGQDVTEKFKKQITESKHMSEVLDELKEKGTVTIKLEKINENTHDIENFSVAVAKANGITEKFKYRLNTLVDEMGDTRDIKYVLDDNGYKQIDKSDKVIKDLEKKSNEYKKILNEFRNKGVVQGKSITDIEALFGEDLKSNDLEKVEQKIKALEEVNKKIQSLSKEEKSITKEAKENSSEMKKIIDSQLKNIDKIEEKFHSLRFVSNKKQDEINAIRKTLNEAKNALNNGEKVEDFELTKKVKDKEGKIKTDKKTGEEITKTEKLEIDDILKRVTSLSNAGELAHKKDAKEAKIRKDLYEDIFNLQKKMAELNRTIESPKAGEKSKEIASSKYKQLEEEYKEKTQEFNKKYFNKTISEELKANGKEFDFKLLEQKAKEVDGVIKNLTSNIEKMKRAFPKANSEELNSLITEIKALNPMSGTLSKDIEDITKKINKKNVEIKKSANAIEDEKEAYNQLIELERKAHSIRKDIGKSTNANEISVLSEQESSYNKRIEELNGKVGKTEDNLKLKDELAYLREANKLELDLIDAKNKNKQLSEETTSIYKQLNKAEDDAFNIEKKLLSTKDENVKKSLEAQLKNLRDYERDLNEILEKNSSKNADKEALLKLKRDRNKVDLEYLRANPSSMGSTDLEKFKKQQEQYLSNLEDKFKHVLKNPEEIQQYINELKKFNPALAEMTDGMDGVIRKHKQFKEELQERARTNKLGEKVSSNLNLESNINDVEKYIKSITDGKGQLTQFGGVVDQNGKKMRQIHYTVEQGKNKFQSFTLTVDASTKSLYKMDKGITDITNRKQSFKDMLSGAFASVAGFTFISGAVMGLINAFKDAIKYTNEMDNALTDLSKVVDLSKSQLESMRTSAIQMGEDLAKSSVEIMKAMAEAGRQFKNPEDIKEFVRVSTLASNVTDLTAPQATKALTVTMKAFHQSIQDVKKDVDSFNEIQNNFRKMYAEVKFSLIYGKSLEIDNALEDN